jgi:hypothetical protein
LKFLVGVQRAQALLLPPILSPLTSILLPAGEATATLSICCG